MSTQDGMFDWIVAPRHAKRMRERDATASLLWLILLLPPKTWPRSPIARLIARRQKRYHVPDTF